ncbi:single-stranded DNA-binding protein [Demequina litorisediminis]|uniref:Fumarylacetoacetase-like C-terminal domain-containing protein n=1 Tax=Demequina litorisediminis TaxID=1849022 RepID=A0ABQ6IJP4_9MICO|nr:single-stranded DNA-binding protein [Demequina litorisediminis]GMA37939.1 hypothetical protein GCM10025876_41430 [Demequina litorisediminis]
MNTFTVPTEGTFPIMGWVATAPVLDDDTVTFDLVVTPRIKNASDDGWTPAPAEWFTVNAYDSLAFHLAQSVRVGEPLLVFGSVGSPSPASGTQRTRHQAPRHRRGTQPRHRASHVRRRPRRTRGS